MPQVDALVTPSVMRWAREQAGFDTATAAKKLDRPETDVLGWENGSIRPSIAQARKASELYKRSLAVFYLPDPPRDFQTLRDFRHLPDTQPAEYSPELALMIRQVHARQQWLREWRETQGEERLSYVGSANTSMSPEVVAASIRDVLAVRPEDQINCQTRRDALNLWIDHAEEAGISVARAGGIECEEARGFVLTDEYAPFVFLNSSDGVAAQLFSLLHEIGHIWLKQPGISNLEHIEKTPRTEAGAIEAFCNEVAAETLLGQSTFIALWQGSASASSSLEERIEWVSRRANVSEEVVARRLLNRQTISIEKYRELRKSYIDRWKQLQKEEKERNKKNEGGPSPHLLRVFANGRAYTQAVLVAYYGGNIAGSEASALLHAKINNLPKIADKAGVLIRSRWQAGGAA